MRWIFLALFVSVAASSSALAQSGAGSQDSSVSGPLRPRWGTYLIETFPSPAKAGQQVTIQYYNHNDEVLMCQIFDATDRLILDVQPKQMTKAGLHTFVIAADKLSTGMYFIRLTSFTASNNEDVVDNSRFLIVH